MATYFSNFPIEKEIASHREELLAYARSKCDDDIEAEYCFRDAEEKFLSCMRSKMLARNGSVIGLNMKLFKHLIDCEVRKLEGELPSRCGADCVNKSSSVRMSLSVHVRIQEEIASHYEELLRYARLKCRTVMDAEDVLQSAVLVFFLGNKHVDYSGSTPGVNFSHLRSLICIEAYKFSSKKALREINSCDTESVIASEGFQDLLANDLDGISSQDCSVEDLVILHIELEQMTPIERHFALADAFEYYPASSMFPLAFESIDGNVCEVQGVEYWTGRHVAVDEKYLQCVGL